ncbi:MAG: TRAM domain-containing protein [Planctomycetota bacterium]|nr:TRAM domain-containing protein [Planctomycetota bacterium]
MLHVLRALFIIISGVIGWNISGTVVGVIIGILLSTFFILIELWFTRKFIAIISIVIFGLIFGFIVAYLFTTVIFMLDWVKDIAEKEKDFKQLFQFSITVLFSFITVIAIIRSKDDFKFVIPFIEFSPTHKAGKPWIIDTSVIIDGRIASIIETLAIDSPIIIPKFILEELQNVADSSDKLKRIRGRYGLDILDQMRKNKKLEIQIDEAEFPYIKETDQKLIKLTQSLNGLLVSNDFNLTKVAKLQGLDVINVNELANLLRPVFLPGETMEVKISRAGEEPNQGVGYLQDGTMVVVEGGHRSIGQRVTVTVTTVLQTAAGKMIFGSLQRY